MEAGARKASPTLHARYDSTTWECVVPRSDPYSVKTTGGRWEGDGKRNIISIHDIFRYLMTLSFAASVDIKRHQTSEMIRNRHRYLTAFYDRFLAVPYRRPPLDFARLISPHVKLRLVSLEGEGLFFFLVRKGVSLHFALEPPPGLILSVSHPQTTLLEAQARQEAININIFVGTASRTNLSVG